MKRLEFSYFFAFYRYDRLILINLAASVDSGPSLEATWDQSVADGRISLFRS